MSKKKASTGKRRTRSGGLGLEVLPSKRLLFSHPSWLRWWWIKDAGDNGTASRITHVACVFVESESGEDGIKHYREVKRGCEALGWTFIPGLRFAPLNRGDWDRMTNPKAHRDIIKRAKRWDSLCLDMEPYGIKSGTRYHAGGEAYALYEAASDWQKFDKPLYVYPPMFRAPFEMLTSCPQGNALDHTTYEAGPFVSRGKLADEIVLRLSYWTRRMVHYWPGFYARYLVDQTVMWAAADECDRCWFFPSATGDDRRNLFRPDWKPRSIVWSS